MSHAYAPEPQAWVDCTQCDFYETSDITQHPCDKCLTCTKRCGFKPRKKDDDDIDEMDREDCTGCEKDM